LDTDVSEKPVSPFWGVCLNRADVLNYTAAEVLKIVLICCKETLIFKLKDAHLISGISLELLVSTVVQFE
jgi:hypothetical protein